MDNDVSPALPLTRAIPSIDEILRSAGAKELEARLGRQETTNIVRGVVDKIRFELGAEQGDLTRGSVIERIENMLNDALAVAKLDRIQRVINATGVIVHTNLGRSPLNAATVAAAVAAAASYCNLEFNLESGARGRRGSFAETLLSDLTGAEDAVIVNNCAAAAFLMLSVFGRGGEVIVSRGELVEIGGDFRIPDVLERSGSSLREVGTTNRTKIADYECAFNENTRLILRVHPSNYRITGFTSSPSLREIADLAHAHNVLIFEDAGSGALIDLSRFGLDEPVIEASIAAGVDLVSFSGDKLLGGSQAGMIAGRSELIAKLRRDPLYRALRPDKITYAIIEATLRAYAKEEAFEQISTLKYLALTHSEINRRAGLFVARVAEKLPQQVSVGLRAGNSAVGGGAAPGVELPTSLISVTHSRLSPDEIARYFRCLETPIVGRVADGSFMMDLRTVEPDDEKLIADALINLGGRSSISGRKFGHEFHEPFDAG